MKIDTTNKICLYWASEENGFESHLMGAYDTLDEAKENLISAVECDIESEVLDEDATDSIDNDRWEGLDVYNYHCIYIIGTEEHCLEVIGELRDEFIAEFE